MAYRVELKPSAEKALSKLPSETQRRIVSRLLTLQANPHPRGAIKLSGRQNLYRSRIGDYRILYQVWDADSLVLVLHLGHRREIHR